VEGRLDDATLQNERPSIGATEDATEAPELAGEPERTGAGAPATNWPLMLGMMALTAVVTAGSMSLRGTIAAPAPSDADPALSSTRAPATPTQVSAALPPPSDAAMVEAARVDAARVDAALIDVGAADAVMRDAGTPNAEAMDGSGAGDSGADAADGRHAGLDARSARAAIPPASRAQGQRGRAKNHKRRARARHSAEKKPLRPQANPARGKRPPKATLPKKPAAKPLKRYFEE